MSDIPAVRNVIQVEETKYKAGVSEATLTRIGAAINFIMDKIFDRHSFEFSGVHQSSDTYDGMGGIRYFKAPVDIDHYYLSNDKAGISGTFAVNFEVYDENNNLLGNLFSVVPSLAFNSGNNALIGRDVAGSSDIDVGTGKVSGTLNYTQLGAGYRIKPFIVSHQTDGENAFFELVVKEQS